MESPAELNLITTLLPLVVIVFIITIGVVLMNQHFRKNLYRQMLEREELKNKYQRDLLHASIKVQEVERKRIAHDLHDEIGALLTTSRLYFNQLSPTQAEEQKQQVSNKINLLFDEMIANIRRISHDLRPVVLENLGLVEGVYSLSEKLCEAGIGFNFSHQFNVQLKKEVELNLFRIIQELIGNTLKHAHATHIFIEMKEEENKFYLHYKDNGIGFVPDSFKNGLGMKSIESRLDLIDGKMQFKQPYKGVYFLMEMEIQKLTDYE
jgi:signal transduction histidine kinase